MFWILPIPTRRRTWGILLLVVAAVLTVVAITADILNFTGNNEIYRMDEVAGEEIATETNYYIPNLYLIDAYAVNDDDDSYYFLCGFFDKNDEFWVTQMQITSTDGIYRDAMDYLDHGNVGDFDQPCYVLCSEVPEDDDLQSFAEDSIKYYVDAGLMSREMVLDVQLEPVWHGGMTLEQAREAQHKEDMMMAFVLNILAVLVGAVGVLLLRSDRKQAPVRMEDRFNTRW